MPGDGDTLNDPARDLDDTVTFDAVAHLARGFWPARTLLTAVDLDLFSRLAGDSLTAAQLAKEVSADPRGVELLANALVALGMLSRSDKGYGNTALSRRFLDRSSEDYRGHAIQLAGWWWTRWSELTDVVRSGESIDGPPVDMMRDFTLAMHQGKPDAGERLVATLDLHGVRRIVDIGCGPGTMIEALARALPEADVVGIDRAEVLAVTHDRLPRDLIVERVSLVAHDFLAEGIPLAGNNPGPYDLAVVSSVLHLLDETGNARLLGHVHDALAPGGRVAIRDFVVDDDGAAPLDSALFALTMLVSTRAGRCYSYARIKEWLHTAGFGEVRLQAFDGPVQLITAHRA